MHYHNFSSLRLIGPFADWICGPAIQFKRENMLCSERLKKWKQTKQRELMKMQARVGRWESVGGQAPGISTTSTNKEPATSAEIPKQTGPSWEAYTKGFGSRMLLRMG